ncbi:hypothetical protein HON36_03200 [Candidatus Parcubacteria bacterium]|jgi:hypothetical protein|nr:hypothetical protein [Candidatus Parcubacteria bacterium]MBT7228768.1 hypothetical protein [Candidatus Parcubacteria bacterium]
MLRDKKNRCVTLYAQLGNAKSALEKIPLNPKDKLLNFFGEDYDKEINMLTNLVEISCPGFELARHSMIINKKNG